jgi:DNA repair protein RadC
LGTLDVQARLTKRQAAAVRALVSLFDGVAQAKLGAFTRFSCSTDIAKYMGMLAQRFETEHVWVVALDAKNGVLAVQEVSVGGVSSASVLPADVYRIAVAMGALSVVLVHNHPSGDVTPSSEDKKLTQRMAMAGVMLGIKLLDHVILASADNHFSFRDLGMLSEMDLTEAMAACNR